MKKQQALYPTSESEAVGFLRPVLDLDGKALLDADADTFKRAWYAIAFLYAGLHPDDAADHGEKIISEAEGYGPVSQEIIGRNTCAAGNAHAIILLSQTEIDMLTVTLSHVANRDIRSGG